MSLFMNMIEHPEIFMNTNEIPSPNQKYYKYDSFEELMKSQREVNTSLQKSFQLLEKIQFKQQHVQMSKWTEVTEKLMKLIENEENRTQFEYHVINRLNKLDVQRKQIEEILVNETELKNEFTEKMNHIIFLHEKLIKEKLDQHIIAYENMSKQLNELHNFQQATSKEQSNITERLESQEALMQKTSRQLTNLRSILYERTNSLAAKVEESYEITSSYLYQLLTGSIEPFSLFLTKKKKEDLKTK